MVQSEQRLLGKLVSQREMAEMEAFAQKHGLWSDGLIDLRGKKVRFSHSGLDLSRFHLESADLSGSRFRDCLGEGASFHRCTLRDVRIEATGRCSFKGASFSESRMMRCYLGPATLDLSNCDFSEAELREVKFMLAKLGGSDFTGARLSDVEMRSADLSAVSFRMAKLQRVCLERASLREADFTGAAFVEMEHWGEPDFTGAKIPDELRYGFACVENPVSRLETVIDRGGFTEEELASLARFRDVVADFVGSAPEAMLIASEYDDVIPHELFVRVLKGMKQVAN